MALEVHVVTHTHWDREWYHPLERFRQRLVALIDELLDDPPAPGESFLLDGQAIILEDYVAVRPEREAELRAVLADGRLEAGPWYVLADELIPGGEALVRNLLTGRRALRRFGAEPPPVLYCPDSFGHPAALPLLANGFGFPLIILWRGYGGARWPAGDTIRWAGPDGERVAVFHLPRDGYELGSNLPTDASTAFVRWRRLRDELAGRSTTGVLLIQNGADHHARQPRHRDALRALEQAAAGDTVHRSSLRRFAERIGQRSATQILPVIRGELRDSYGYTWTLQGTFATRAHEKRMNAQAERLLVCEAEPWAALAAALAGRSRRPLLNAAWQTLLAAHPHDTLCGCSIDDVAAAMEQRVRSATVQGQGVRDDAILDLIGYDAAHARTATSQWRSAIVVRNAASRPRSGVATLDLREFIADVAVGPGSAASEPVAAKVSETTVVGRLGTVQALARSTTYDRVESPVHYPDNDLVAQSTVVAWVNDVPAYGLLTHATVDDAGGRNRAPDAVAVGAHSLGNATLSVEVGSNGDVTLTHLATRRRIDHLITVHDEIDLGDLYTPSPRGEGLSPKFVGMRRVHRGPLRGELALQWRFTKTAARGRAAAEVELAVHLVLDAGAPFLSIRVVGDNQAHDHRVRIAINTDVASPAVWADAAFGPVVRKPIEASADESAIEQPPPTAPLHRYVSLFDETRGCTVFSDGLAEYESRADGSVLVTLVRAVGELSRNDLPERPGHAGWPAPTPAAQCVGPFEASLAVMPHGPRVPATVDAIERAADDVLLPLTGTTLRSMLDIPGPVLGAELIGPGLAFSALKESEDGEWIVLRCVSLVDADATGLWRLGFPVEEARLARLDETPGESLVVEQNGVAFKAGARAVVTVLVR